MYSEKTEIVDVVTVDNTYSLSKKAGDLYEAARNGDVIRRHNISDSPAVVNFAYVGLSEVKKDGSGYSFTFASGDEFTASDADAYPYASSISDAFPAPAPQNVVYIKVGDTFTAEEFAALKKHVSDGGCVICGMKEESMDLMYYSSNAYAGADYIAFQFNCTSIEIDNATLYVQSIVVNASGWNSPYINEYVLTAKT